MIKLPFEFNNVRLNEYSGKVIGYKGYDLSFLTSQTTNYINNWNLPDVKQGHDDREIEITYLVDNVAEAKALARLFYILGSSDTDNRLLAKDSNGNSGSMKYVVESVSWDDWSNNIRLTVHLITETGFIITEKHEYADWGNFSVEPNGKEDIIIRVFWSTPPTQDVRIHLYQTGYNQFDTEIYLKANGASEFLYNTYTGNGRYGNLTIAEAILENKIKFTMPENLLIKPGSDSVGCTVSPSNDVLAKSYITVYSREFIL